MAYDRSGNLGKYLHKAKKKKEPAVNTKIVPQKTPKKEKSVPSTGSNGVRG